MKSTLSKIRNRFEASKASLAIAGLEQPVDVGAVYRFIRGLGIKLETEGDDDLRIGFYPGASPSVMTDSVRDLLAEHKTGLIEIVRPLTPAEVATMVRFDWSAK